jgi:Na+/proline symporter
MISRTPARQMTTLGARPWREQTRGTHAFVTTRGMLAVVNAALAGVIAAMAASVVGTGPGIAAAAGLLGFLICYAGLHRYTLKQIKLFRRWNQPRFPTPE